MTLLLIASVILGLIFGLSGLISGIHINNVLPIFNFLQFSSDILALAIIFSSVLFSYLTFIPAAIFSYSTQDSFATVNVISKYYENRQAYYAIYLSAIGGFYGFLFSLPISIIFILIVERIEFALFYMMPIILILTFFFLLFSAKNFYGIIAIFLSSYLGVIVLNSSLYIKNPLFVLIGGLFGFSNMYFLIFDKKIVLQDIYIKKVKFLSIFKIGVIASLMSIFVNLFAGIGGGIATYFSSKISHFNDDEYIMVNGAINTIVISISFYSAILIEKFRTSSSLHFFSFFEYSTYDIFYIFFFLLFSISLSFLITLFIAKKIIIFYNFVDRRKLLFISLFIIFISLFLFTNFLGIVIFFLASFVGFFNIKSNNPRILMMSSIIVPVFFYFM